MRSLAAEFLGTGLLLFVIVGSGIAVEGLSTDGAVQLLAHAVAVGAGLAALIAFLGPISGAHFNPAVTFGFWFSGSFPARSVGPYVGAQIAGAVLGVMVANASFGEAVVAVSDTPRGGAGPATAEFVATFVLVLLILGLVRSGRTTAVAPAVGAWVAAIIVATVSTGFANPAVTVARTVTDTYTGIAPASGLAFVAVQLIAGVVAAPVASTIYDVDRPIRQPEREPA